MELREFNKAQLQEFIASGEYASYAILPITPMRAASQLKNPYAADDDVLLIIAFNDEKEICAYCGLLPGRISGGRDEKIWWNSCWWVDPVKGRGMAMQLFFRMLKLTGKNMAFAELTPHTRKIVAHFDDFIFPDVPVGLRGFMRVQISELLPPKSAFFKKIRFLLLADDAVRNVLFGLLFYAKKIRRLPAEVRVEESSAVDEEAGAFIAALDGKVLFNRTREELNQIIENPWILERSVSNRRAYENYYFSAVVRMFSQRFYKIFQGGRLCGVLVLTNRDGFLKVPYCVFSEDDARTITAAIYYLLGEEKWAHTFTTFHPWLVREMRKGRSPFVFKRKISRNFAINKVYGDVDFDRVLVPDGAGDGIFT